MNDNKQAEKRVFIIDDDRAIREILTLMIADIMLTPIAFSSGAEALQEAAHNAPDIVLLDYFLPGENAEEIVYALRKLEKEQMRIHLMSANTSAEEIAKRLPVDSFLSKPFQMDAVFAAMET